VSYPNLNLLLRAAHRRQLFLEVARVGLNGLAATLLALLMALAWDAIFAAPAWVRWLLDGLLLAVVLVMLGKLWHVLRRGRFDARRIARSLEVRLQLTDNALINAVDFRDGRGSSTSRGLAKLAVERGETAARQVNVPQAIPSDGARRSVRRAGLAMLAASVLFVLLPGVFARGLPRLADPHGDHPPFTLVRFAVETQPNPLYYGASAVITAQLGGSVVPQQADLVFVDGEGRERLPMIATDQGYRLDLQRVEQSRRFYIDTPEGRSDWHELSVEQVPLLEELVVTYHYPEYTALPPRRSRLLNHKIEAPVGTQVTLEAESNYPLMAARVEFFDSQASPSRATLSLAPDRQSSRTARGTFRLTRSGRLAIRLVGANERLGPELHEVPMVAVADRPPHVTLADLEPLTLAVEGWKVPLIVEANDDFRVAELRAHYVHTSPAAQTVPLSTHSADARQMRGEAELDLARMQAKPGDRIRLFAMATDNHPDGGQAGDSASHMIEVISQEAYLEYLRSVYQAEQLLEEIAELNERLDGLAAERQEILERAEKFERSLADGQPLDAPQREEQQRLRQNLERYVQQADELSRQLDERLAAPQIYDGEQAYRARLEALNESLVAQRQGAEELAHALEELAERATPNAADRERLSAVRERLQKAAEQSNQQGRGLAESRQLLEKLQQALRMTDPLQRIEAVVREQRELANRLQTLEVNPAAEHAQQRRADQLARQQERLNQVLDEAASALRTAADEAKESLPRTSADACRLCDSIEQAGVSGDQQQAARAARQGAVPQAQQSAQQAAEKLESLACPSSGAQDLAGEWNADELDRGLGLSRQGVAQMLQQMLAARSASTLGANRNAVPTDARRSAGDARVGLHGPRPPSEIFAARRGRRADSPVRGGAESFRDEPSKRVEVIDASARHGTADAAGNVRGVPVGYRDQAEAYFRRLAEEAVGLEAEGKE
jgi:hypothetical protein